MKSSADSYEIKQHFHISIRGKKGCFTISIRPLNLRSSVRYETQKMKVKQLLINVKFCFCKQIRNSISYFVCKKGSLFLNQVTYKLNFNLSSKSIL